MFAAYYECLQKDINKSVVNVQKYIEEASFSKAIQIHYTLISLFHTKLFFKGRMKLASYDNKCY